MSRILDCTGYDMLITDIVSGDGCYLYDSKGKRYIDFESGVWCTSLGHNNKQVNEAIKMQIDKITHFGYKYTNELIEEAAEMLIGTTQINDGKCIFLSSGSEAVEFGANIAKGISQKPLLLTLSGSYLAAYGSAGRRNNDEWYIFNWGQCADCANTEECDSKCPILKEIPFENIGGMVFEPGNSSGLVKLPPKQLVKTLSMLIKQNNGLIIIDEVTTGFGRTGKWYGYEHYNLNPDIIAAGKGIGNGYPVSAVIMTKQVGSTLERMSFRYGQSHQNDPVGCAAAKEVIRVMMQDKLVERSRNIGEEFLKKLKVLQSEHAIIKQARGRGLMIALEFNSDNRNFSLEMIYHKLIDMGFIIGYKPAANILRFYPALNININDITDMLHNLDNVLRVS